MKMKACQAITCFVFSMLTFFLIWNYVQQAQKEGMILSEKQKKLNEYEKEDKIGSTGKTQRYYLTNWHDHGRLGNRMFKYASLLGIAKSERRHPFILPHTNNGELAKMFNITKVEFRPSKILEKWPMIKETSYSKHDPVFSRLPHRDLRIYGYVQSWKYFKDIEDDIRKEFTFLPHVRLQAHQILREIINKYKEHQNVSFIGVHVRRKDEFSNPLTCEAPKSYFTNAFQKMKELLPHRHLVYLITGNELSWCETNLTGNDLFVLKAAKPETHMAVLASCDHVVMTVGSFGFWAGWLAKGHVIYYKKYPIPESYEFKGFVREDYYPPSWIAVDD